MSAATTDRITVSMSDGVADVRLVRADKMNALDVAMFNALVDTAERLKAKRDCARWCCPVRARVLRRSRHGTFCRDGRRHQRSARPCQAHAWPRQSLAAGGMGLAATAGAGDRRRARRRLRRRIPVGDRRRHAVSGARHPHVGDGNQMGTGAGYGGHADPCAFGARRHPARSRFHRPDFLGARGDELRLATRICDDPRAEALAAAREIAGKNPGAIRGIKRMLNNLGGDPVRRCWRNPSSR